MNREIKFRAWDKETKEMSYDFLSKNWLKVCIESPYIELMQYTGLKDRNGKEIYEGDIIEGYFDYKKNRYEIVFGSDACYYGRSAPYNGLPNGGRQTVGLNNISDWAEVIGNVWENGGLLNEGD